MIVAGQGLLRSGAHSDFQLAFQLFPREGRQGLPLPFKRLDAQPKQPARGYDNRDDVDQDGAPVETRHLPQCHFERQITTISDSKSHELSHARTGTAGKSVRAGRWTEIELPRTSGAGCS